jgi:lysozyme
MKAPPAKWLATGFGAILAFVAGMEGMRYVGYLDPVGIPTVCAGHTGPEVRAGMRVSPAECVALLNKDMQTAGRDVARCVRVPVTREQFDALTSFTFNVGGGAMCRSTLVRKLNAGDCTGAAAEFSRWTRAGGKELPGLVRRRAAERAMFEGGC